MKPKMKTGFDCSFSDDYFSFNLKAQHIGAPEVTHRVLVFYEKVMNRYSLVYHFIIGFNIENQSKCLDFLMVRQEKWEDDKSSRFSRETNGQ